MFGVPEGLLFILKIQYTTSKVRELTEKTHYSVDCMMYLIIHCVACS
jgi:hypothetical protein